MWISLNNTLYFAHCVSNNLFSLDGSVHGTYKCTHPFTSHFDRCVVGGEPILHGNTGGKLNYSCIYNRHVSIHGNDELFLPKNNVEPEYVSIEDMNHSMVTELKGYPNVTYFMNEHWSKNEPVLMKNSLIMRSDWNFEYISSKMGHVVYNGRPVSKSLKANVNPQDYRNWEVQKNMYNDIEIPNMLRSKFFMDKLEKIVLWVSSGNTVSPLHRDAGNFYIGQIKGIKHIYLLNPLNSINLYSDIFAYNSSYGSTFKPLSIDINKYPLARYMSIKKCTLHPGDVLFLPEYTWHVVISEPGENIGITMQFFPYLQPSSHFSVAVANEFVSKRINEFKIDSLNEISNKWHSGTFGIYDPAIHKSWTCKNEHSVVNFESKPHEEFCKCFQRSNDKYWTQDISRLIEHQWFTVRLSMGECMKAASVNYKVLLEIFKCGQISSRWIALNTLERILNDISSPLLSNITRDITNLIDYEKPGTKWIAMKALSFLSSLGVSMDSTLLPKLLAIMNTDFGFPSISVAAIELILQVYNNTNFMNDIVNKFKKNLNGDILNYVLAQVNQGYLNPDEFENAENVFLHLLTNTNDNSMWNSFFKISAHRQTSLLIRNIACSLIDDKNSNYLSRYMALKYMNLFDDDAALDVVAKALDDSICALRFTASEILRSKFKLEHSHIKRILDMMISNDEYTRFVASFTIRRCAQQFCENSNIIQEIIASLIGFAARNINDPSIRRTIRSIENAMLRCSSKYIYEPVSTNDFEIATLQTHHIPALQYDNHCCVKRLATRTPTEVDYLINSIDKDCSDLENLNRLADRGFVVIKNFMSDMSEINAYLKTAQNHSIIRSRVLMGRLNNIKSAISELPYTTEKLQQILKKMKTKKLFPSSKLHGEGSGIHSIDFILIDPDGSMGASPDWHVDGPGDFNGFKRRIFKMWMLQQTETYNKTGIKVVSMKTLNNICEHVNHSIPLVTFGTCTNTGLDSLRHIYDKISCTPDIKEGDMVLWHPGIVHRTQDYDTRRVTLLGEAS